MLGVMNSIAQASAAPVTGPKLDNRRVLAGIVDLAIVAVGAVVVLFAGDALSGDRSEVQGALAAVILGWSLYYYFALESGGGQTVGKKLMKLRVVRVDGSPVGMREVAVRTVLRVVDGAGAYIVGLIVMLATGRRRQRIGDLAAGTIVIDASKPSLVPAAAAPVADPVEETAAEEPEAAAEAAPVEEPVADVEPLQDEPFAEDALPEITSPSLEELARDLEAAQAEPEAVEVEDVAEVEDEDDGPVTVKSVETVSAIDLVMGGAPADEAAPEDSSESPQDGEDSASR
jgi:uncharacterized RDD family membrane protein YckC